MIGPLSGEGAARHGGRFNRPVTPALYTSLDPVTAWFEAQQAFVFKPQPMTLVTYEVDCDHLADLEDKGTLARLNASAIDLACPWEDLADRGMTPPTWRLVDRLLAAGAHGAMAPSQAPGAPPGAVNLVFWQRDATCRIEVIDDFGNLSP
ncbi:MAG: RES domain-containing protein [Gammaproteobacteria bacterium]|nr:RES domain-containing protein [Gammaproteobacteria bacterium]